MGGAGHGFAHQGEQLQDHSIDAVRAPSSTPIPTVPPSTSGGSPAVVPGRTAAPRAGYVESADPAGVAGLSVFEVPVASELQLVADDHPWSRAPGEVAPRPVNQDDDLVPEPDQVHEVEAQPGQPARVPRTMAPRGNWVMAARRPMVAMVPLS